MNRSDVARAWRGALGAACALLIAGAIGPLALADENEEEQRYLAPTVTGETGLFTLLTGQTLPKGKWSFSIYYNNWDRLVAPSPALEGLGLNNEWDYDWHRISASVGYGITDRFELSLMAPYEWLDAKGEGQYGAVNGHTFLDDIDAKGAGNVRLGMHVRVVGEHDGYNVLALNAFVEAPTGDDEEGVVTGDPGFGAGLAFTHRRFTLNAGFRDPGDADLLDVSPELHAGFGYAHPVTDSLDWISEIHGIFYTDSDVAPDDNVDLATGVRIWFGEDSNWAFNVALRTDLAQIGDADEFCPLGGLVGLTFFPRAHEKEAEKPEPPAPPPPKPEPPKPVPPPPAPPPPPETRIECAFKAGSARVDNICKARLDEAALKMKQDPALKAVVTGYARAAGEAAALKLSKQRAENVKKFLVDRHRIDPSRITTEGMGGAEPSDRIVIVLK